MLWLVLLILASTFFLIISRRALKNPRSHGFFRFFIFDRAGRCDNHNGVRGGGGMGRREGKHRFLGTPLSGLHAADPPIYPFSLLGAESTGRSGGAGCCGVR